MEKPDKATLEAWHNDPANWRMGVFYYIPKVSRFLKKNCLLLVMPNNFKRKIFQNPSCFGITKMINAYFLQSVLQYWDGP
ncbi:MAG: hypothetical protein IPP29_02915 [Bacteroidetes bacterium]|nr:hypothetical protein [Bacteroidota bacterium]